LRLELLLRRRVSLKPLVITELVVLRRGRRLSARRPGIRCNRGFRHRRRDGCRFRGLDPTLGAHAAADENAAQKNEDRDDRGGHEQKDELLPAQLDFVEGVVVERRRIL
jgi:hypothetical protein